MTDQASQLRHARRAATWVGVVIPLGLTLVSTIIVAFALPRLPAEVAIQFNFTGAPSNFGPAPMQLVLTLGVGGLLSVMSLWTTRQPNKAGQVWTRSHRFMPALMLGVVAMIQIMAVGTTLMQVDLANARDIANPAPLLICALVSWPVLTLVGYLVQPKLIIAAPASDAVAPLPLAPGERVVWVGTTSLAPAALVVIGVAVTAAIGTTLALALLGNEYWWTSGVLALILIISALLATVYRVRIDHTGLTARTPFGWPVFRLPASDVDTVTVGEINPFGEFGGWGIRTNLDGFGLTLRSGPGLRIKRRSGKMFVITLDDAHTAASVLSAAAAAAGSKA